MTIKAFTEATLFDGTGAKPVRDAIVLIEGDRVKEAGGGIDVPRDAEVIPLGGRYVLPGLIDSHLHLCSNGDPDIMKMVQVPMGMLQLYGYRNALMDLEAGFTTVRDMGAPYGFALALRLAVNQGLVKGPRILAPGKVISMTGGHADFYLPSGFSFEGMSRIADGVPDCHKAAREQLRDGADFVKICSSGGVMSPADPVDTPQFSRDEIAAIVYEAGCHGRYVASHAHGATGIKNAVETGVRTIEHGSLVDDEAVRMMKERGCFHVPTLVAGWNIVEHGVEGGIPEYAVEKAKAIAYEVGKNTMRSHRGGVKVAAGTDAGTPFNRHGGNAQEIIHLVEAGLKPAEALMAATRVASECIGMADRVGTLEPGKLADLIVVEGDPLKDVKVLGDKANIRLVVKGGAVEVDRGL